MSRFQAYSDGCIHFNVENPYANEEEYNRAYGITEEVEIPMFIAQKAITQEAVKPTLEMHRKIKKAKIRTRRVITSEEERKSNRTRWMREKREDWKASGLTCRGEPYKVKPCK